MRDFKERPGHKEQVFSIEGLETRAIGACFPIPQNNTSRIKHLYIRENINMAATSVSETNYKLQHRIRIYPDLEG